MEEFSLMADLMAAYWNNILNLIRIRQIMIDKCPGCPGPDPGTYRNVTQFTQQMIGKVHEVQTLIASDVLSGSRGITGSVVQP